MFTFKFDLKNKLMLAFFTLILVATSGCIKSNGEGVPITSTVANHTSSTPIDPTCGWNNMVTNGATQSSPGRTEYVCPFYNPGGSPSGSYIFSFYDNLKTDNQMMTYPSFLTVDYSIDQATCTLIIFQGGVPKFDLTNPVLNGSNELTGFHHFCVYCGGNDNAVGCTKRASTH